MDDAESSSMVLLEFCEMVQGLWDDEVYDWYELFLMAHGSFSMRIGDVRVYECFSLNVIKAKCKEDLRWSLDKLDARYLYTYTIQQCIPRLIIVRATCPIVRSHPHSDL